MAPRQPGQRNARGKRVTREERADFFFLVYAALGAERSIDLLHDHVIKMGISPAPSRNTLGTYSRDYEWQRRVREFDAKRQQARETVLLREVIQDDSQHIQMARAMQEVGLLALQHYRTPEGAKGVRAGEAASLVEKGVKLARLIGGQATEIVEVATSVINGLGETAIRLHLRSQEAALKVYEDAYGADPAIRQRALDASAAIYGPSFDQTVADILGALGMEAAYRDDDGDEDEPA